MTSLAGLACLIFGESSPFYYLPQDSLHNLTEAKIVHFWKIILEKRLLAI